MRAVTDSAKENPIVLVVDDDPSVRRSLRRVMESAGFQVETFAGAREFLAAFQPGNNMCLILDVQMPYMNGLELQKVLTQRGADIPTIMISGYANQRMKADAANEGALAFLEKPFEEEELLEYIHHALGDASQAPQGS
jgi:FixJ family two-component response regulator